MAFAAAAVAVTVAVAVAVAVVEIVGVTTWATASFLFALTYDVCLGFIAERYPFLPTAFTLR